MSLIINKQELIRCAPIRNMETEKKIAHGMSYGLSEAGYDIRCKQRIEFYPAGIADRSTTVRRTHPEEQTLYEHGRFILASSVEEFDMPADMVGEVKDKSSWARQGLSVFNTVIEPGWRGFLTLELVFHGSEPVMIPAGAPIAQVLFQHTVHAAAYNGKYQNQSNEPVSAISEK